MSTLSPISTTLRLGILPGAALGGLLGGATVTNLVNRMSIPRERQGLFLRRRPRRRCPRCAGFGISRCTLCNGEAICVRHTPTLSTHITLYLALLLLTTISQSNSARYTRVIPCPRCLMRRYIPCAMCNGLGLRRPHTPLTVASVILLRLFDVLSNLLPSVRRQRYYTLQSSPPLPIVPSHRTFFATHQHPC